MSKKIYVLVAYSSDGRLYNLGYSPSLKEVRKAVNSEEVKEQLKELNVKECEFWIRDNYYPTNYYGVQ